MTEIEGNAVTEQPVAEPKRIQGPEQQAAPQPESEEPPAEQAASLRPNSRRHRSLTMRPPHKRGMP